MLEAREIACPYCGESIAIDIDASGGSQTYIEDCQVCCRPIVFKLSVSYDGDVEAVTAVRDDE